MTGQGRATRRRAGRPPRGRLSLTAGIALIVVLVVGASFLLQTLRDDVVAVAASPWPGAGKVTTVEDSGLVGEDVSGLSLQTLDNGEQVLWAVRNSPGVVHRLVPDGAGWQATDEAWGAGRQLRDMQGEGDPDAEALVFVNGSDDDAIYIAMERDNDEPDVSSLRVLRYAVDKPRGGVAVVSGDVSGAQTAGSDEDLIATHDWNLSSDFATSTAPNEGFEGIAHVPDDVLVSSRFLDESTGKRYNPDAYGPHADGVFFVSMEVTGMVYGYVLEDDGGFTRIATIDSGLPAVAELEYEPDTGLLWAVCDDVCAGASTALELKGRWFWSRSRFTLAERYDRPTGLPDANNEGFAIARDSSCTDDLKPVYWSDDHAGGGHVLRAGEVRCSAS